MSVILTVWTKEGIVMGSDSRITFKIPVIINPNTAQQQTISMPYGHYFDNQYKTYLCPNGCGISTCGDIHLTDPTTNKPTNIQVYIEDYIAKQVNQGTSIFDTANNLYTFIRSFAPNNEIKFIVAGYNNGVPEVYSFFTNKNQAPTNGVVLADGHGLFWGGEEDILQRLLRTNLDPTSAPIDAQGATVTDKSNNVLYTGDCVVLQTNNFIVHNPLTILWDLMSLQDVIDFTRYCINTTIETMRFVSQPKTVGGPIDILVIKPNGQAEWIAHKEFH